MVIGAGHRSQVQDEDVVVGEWIGQGGTLTETWMTATGECHRLGVEEIRLLLEVQEDMVETQGATEGLAHGRIPHREDETIVTIDGFSHPRNLRVMLVELSVSRCFFLSPTISDYVS